MIRTLTGKSTDHLIFHKKRLFHKKMLPSFLALKDAAKEEGIDLYVISSFRSYEDQLKIWNEKALGIRPILDDQGRELTPSLLSKHDLLRAILRFSAFPGLSRHHWGTDLDLVDKNAYPAANYKVQLTHEESAIHFKKLHEWLDERIKSNHAFGFYRPYEFDVGAVATEKWHLSHYPTAKKFSYLLSTRLIKEIVMNSKAELKKELLQDFDFLVKCVRNR